MQYRTTDYAAHTFDTFYFEKNLQGDIIAVYNADGEKIGSYTYDAWGNMTVTTTSGNTMVENGIVRTLNPFRYRGYYYDTETGLYYLQSRYYDARIGRFINADGYVSTGQGLTGNNMFAYCGNDPVNYVDPNGKCRMLFGILRITDCKQRDCPNSKYYVPVDEAILIGTYNDGRRYVYVVTIYDNRAAKNPDMRICNSYRIFNANHQRDIAQLMLDYNDANPVNPAWSRTLDSLVKEWKYHNFAHNFLWYKPAQTAHCDFDNADEGKTFWDYIGR